MYLLIPYSVGYRATWKLYLHPTMYLLIRYTNNVIANRHLDLHPTMYLLIPEPQMVLEYK